MLKAYDDSQKHIIFIIYFSLNLIIINKIV